MNKAQFIDRLTDFAVRVIKMARSLPRDAAGWVIGGQVISSATSIVANAEESVGAESRRDFLHKYRIARKEARETLRWLVILQRSALLPPRRLESLLAEANEIVAILTKSVKTVEASLMKTSV